MSRRYGGDSVPVARVAFGLMLVAAAALYLRFTRSTAPFSDEWIWALQRRGGSPATFLAPYNGHLVLLPVSIYKVLWATVGLRSYLPYRLVVTAFVLGCAVLVFVYVRRRVGEPGALVASALILFYGPGWQDLLWPFQITWLGSIAGGLIALIGLDHRSRRAEIAACLGVILSLACSSVGVAIAAGLAIDVLARADRRRRAWVVLGPLALYAIWWVTRQRTSVTSGSLAHTPAFVAHMLAASLSGLLGLWHAAPAHQTEPVGWRIALVPLAGLALVGGLVARFSLRAAVLAAMALLFAVSAGVNRAGLSPGVDSRYLFIVAVFAVLCAVELIAGRVWTRPAGLVLAALAAAVCLVNLDLARQAGAHLRLQAVNARADVAAVAIDRGAIPRGYIATHFPGYPFIVLPAQGLMAAVHALGFPIPSPAQVQTYPEAARQLADSELSLLEDVAPSATASARVAMRTLRPGCTQVVGAQSARSAAAGIHGREFVLPPPGLVVTSQGDVTVIAARRFATTFGNTGVIGGRAPQLLRAPSDGVSPAWQVRIAPTGTATVCPA